MLPKHLQQDQALFNTSLGHVATHVAPSFLLHRCLGDQVNICRVMHDFGEGPPNNLPPPPPIPGIKEYKRKYEECKNLPQL